jgi:hypothetical protein
VAESLIERYLTDVGEIHATGANAPETSFYPALERLLSDIGRSLSPKVRCVINLANRGAGLPDGGLFTADQFRGKPRAEANPFDVQTPSRGVIEAKPPTQDVARVAESEQVERYWKRYGMVLVTNFREFSIVGKDPDGRPRMLESFVLADSATEFWELASHPRKAAAERGERLLEYLRRALLHNAPLAEPRDVAAILASYARDARLRIESADIPALGGIRQALEEALGLQFEGEKGEHFFRSTLVQTLFYGVFSAWVLWARRHDARFTPTSYGQALRERPSPYTVAGAFDWRTAHWLLRVPMLRALFVQVADPGRLGALGLIEVLDWAANALNRVDRAKFFESFDAGHAVQYFYEPFLHAFDPELQKDLGVWYTPEEIVRYQVERVDAVLRSELGLVDGLADPKVVVLDPCCGTGAYLRAVLRRIHTTLHDKGGDALVAHDLKKAAMERLFGFEILPAPFVIAHLQLGLELETLGAPLSDAADPAERVGVYLTNALTGWEPAKTPKTRLLFAEMEEERDAANHIKLGERILVVLGNPPYNGYAGMAITEERGLSEAYRTTRRASAPHGQGLNDLYVRFFRMAERRIIELNRPAQGVICFISNYSWLDGLSFTGMRERFVDQFSRIWIDCLNGDKYKTGKLAPDGQPDPSVFSTEFSPEGIQVGTAIALLVRKQQHQSTAAVEFRHLWGRNKRVKLLEGPGEYKPLTPVLDMGLSFMPGQVASGYFAWPLLPDLFPASFPGVKTSRDDLVVDIDRDRLLHRMQDYFNPKLSNEEIRRRMPAAMTSTPSLQAEAVRSKLLKRGFLSDKVVRYCYRPFDMRWLYWEPETALLDRKRSDYFGHVREGNAWLSAGQHNRMEDFYQPQFAARLADHHIVESNVGMFPAYLYNDGGSLLDAAGRKPNLSDNAMAYLAQLHATPEELFYHTLATLHAPAYRTANAGALRQDWPRVPLPDSGELLRASATLGRQVGALLDVEAPVPGVTAGKIGDELKGIAVFARVDGKPAKPEAGDLDVSAGWGHAGKGGVTMPGTGKVVEHGDVLDVYLNEVACWRNVPKAVWEYTIGGYQVIKKWLSYREKDLLGRSLTPDEARYVTDMARRIGALVVLQPTLDQNYAEVTTATYSIPTQ